ncbi:hypothetical protein [Duganella vulcania]|uniref:hypothetical protein n=1 Tax=Duganella vulcania TaxID=2692166 RepID=UPI0020C41903|nr:hypothetical protein [Duganella vulcania]
MSRRIIELHTLERTPDWRRRGWLALIAGAHVLAFIGWRAPERLALLPVPPQPGITYIVPPFVVPPQRRPAPPPRQLKSVHQPAAPRMTPLPATPQAQPIQQPAQPPAPQAITQTTPPPDPFAQPSAKPAEDLLQRSLKSAAAVDRQLRKEAWNPHDKKIANNTTVLAAKLGGAFVGDEGTTFENFTTPDGRLMTRVRSGDGSYCAVMESNSLTGGRDPFRDGVKTKVGTCPH